MPKAPCRGCEKRRLNCHSSCEEYKEFEAGFEIGAQERDVNRFINEYVMNRVVKVRKRRRK